MVDRPPSCMERKNVCDGEAVDGRGVRRLHPRLGSDVQRSTHGRPMVPRGEPVAHKLSGGTRCLPRSEMLCPGKKRRFSAVLVGQYFSRLLHQQAGRDSIPEAKCHCQRPMAVVHEQGNNPDGGTPSGGSEHGSRRGVPDNEGSLRLEAESSDFRRNPAALGPPISGPVCFQADNPAHKVLQLENGSRGGSPGCFQPRLVEVTGEGLCQPPLEPCGQSAGQSPSADNHNSPDCPSVEESAVVSNTTGVPGGLPDPPASMEGSDPPYTSRECSRDDTPTSRLAYLRQRYQDKEISQEGTELLLASWRQKSSKSYDSLFKKWAGWCCERSSDPVSRPISEVVNFLAHLFKEGYQYRSLNAYRSAISSVHERVDGCEVGKHPLVSRVLKGAFNLQPPQPCYVTTWDVAGVMNFLVSQGPSDNLTLRHLSWKLAMLLALIRLSRSADLAKLDLRFRRVTPEGVVFQEAGLAKQSRAGKPRAEFFFPAFEDPVCAPRGHWMYMRRGQSASEGKERLDYSWHW